MLIHKRVNQQHTKILLTLVALLASSNHHALAGEGTLHFGESFGKTWHDGLAEIAAYSLDVTRYREARKGNAVAIFVTEPFSKSRRVKIDRMTEAKAPDQIEVLKLNLVRDFPTGIYDYNTMLSVFVASEDSKGMNPGQNLKTSYSSQEWCGHVYAQLIPYGDRIDGESHSYFEDEGDETASIQRPPGALLADSLFHWARGFAEPVLAPGEETTRPLLNPLSHIRLAHQKPVFSDATFSISKDLSTLSAAGQNWNVRTHTVSSKAGLTYRFWVEESSPYRIIQWKFEGAEGVAEKAMLLGVKRLPYWNQKSSEFTKALREIGLEPRSPLSP